MNDDALGVRWPPGDGTAWLPREAAPARSNDRRVIGSLLCSMTESIQPPHREPTRSGSWIEKNAAMTAAQT